MFKESFGIWAISCKGRILTKIALDCSNHQRLTVCSQASHFFRIWSVPDVVYFPMNSLNQTMKGGTWQELHRLAVRKGLRSSKKKYPCCQPCLEKNQLKFHCQGELRQKSKARPRPPEATLLCAHWIDKAYFTKIVGYVFTIENKKLFVDMIYNFEYYLCRIARWVTKGSVA